MFTVYLRDIPADVQLTAIYLNGHECTASLRNASTHTITEVLHPNDTRCYILKVPFDDSVVIKQVKVSEFVQWLLQISGRFIHGDVILLASFIVLQRRRSNAAQVGLELHTDRCARK